MFDQRPNKRGSVTGGDAWVFFAVAGLVVLALVVVGVLWVSALLGGHGYGGPVQWLLGQGSGPRWSTVSTVWAAAFFLAIAALALWIGREIAQALSHRQWTDNMASSMSSRRDLAELSEKAVAEDTIRLGSQGAGLGIRLGRAVLNGQWLMSTYESSRIWILGTRAGKTRAVAVPHLVEHLGGAVATSNKGEIVYLTLGPRSELGRCWIQDPMDIYGAEATWWWNPLTFVTGLERAQELAAIWLASRSAREAAAADPYFEPQGRQLLADFLMVAAAAGESVTRVLQWAQFPDGEAGIPNPQELARQHGYDLLADDINAKNMKASDERSGIYGTAESALGFLLNPKYLPWITRMGADDFRPEFRPDAFVRKTETLYLLSKQGDGSSRAITGALTAAVYAAGERYAERNGDRVPTPLLFELDEAANVCRWPELPELYSHAGGKGLILEAILQSKRQAERAWGSDGFEMMWSSANIAVAGRGINDVDHLSDISRLIGTRQIRDGSITVGTGGHRSTSTQNRDEVIFTEADLRAFPRGRAVLFAAGVRAILLDLVDLSELDNVGERVLASREAFKREPDPDDGEYDDEEEISDGTR